MAGSRTFVVRILADSKEAIAGLKKVGNEANKIGNDMDKGLGATLKNMMPSFRTLATIGAAAFGTAAVGAYKLTQAGSNLSESMSKVNAVFGESAFRIQEFSKTTAASLGITRQQTLEAAGTFGNLIQAFGIARTDAAAMSENMVKLAADLASFNNVPIEDVFTALRSGLSGETEPLKRFGVALNDVRLKQEALNMGIYDGKGALDITAKTQAAYALILKDTALAQGDVERTSGGFANQMRFLQASLADAAAELGLALLPYAERFVKFINENIVPAIKAFASQVGERGLGGAFIYAIASMGNFGNATIDVMENISIGVLTALKDILSFTERVSQAVVLISAARGNVRLALKATAIGISAGEAEERLGERLKTLGKDFDNLRVKVASAGLEVAKFRRLEGLYATFDELKKDRLIGRTTEDLTGFEGAVKTGTGTVKKAKDVLKEYTDAIKAAGKAQDSYNASIKSSNKAQASLTEANANLAEAQRRFNQAVAGYGADSQQAKDAQRALDQAQRGVERAGYRVEESVFAIADAERELAEVRSRPDVNPQDVREAEIRLAEAKLSVADATDSQYEATKNLTDAQALLNEVVNGAIKGSATYEELSKAVADAEQRKADAIDAVTEATKRQQEALEALQEAIKKTQGFGNRPGFVTSVPNPVGMATSTITDAATRFTGASFAEAHNAMFGGVNITVYAGIGTSGVQVGQELDEYLNQYYRLSGGSFDRYGNLGIG